MKRLIAAAWILSLVGVGAPADASTQSSGDFIYVTKKSKVIAGASAALVALCPDGTKTVGAGGSVSGRDLLLSRVTPYDDEDGDTEPSDGVLVEVHNLHQERKSFSAVAICSRGSDVASLTYHTNTQFLSSGSSAGSAFASCTGEKLIGGGGGVPPNPYDRLTVAQPFAASWRFGITGVNPNDRTTTGIGICLPEVGREIVINTRSVHFRPFELRTVHVGCPGKKRVTSGGANAIQYDMLRSLPIDGPDADTKPDQWQLKLRRIVDSPDDLDISAVCVGPVP